MNIKFIVDDSETLRELRERFPDRFLRNVAIVLKNLARNSAQEQARFQFCEDFLSRKIRALSGIKSSMTIPATEKTLRFSRVVAMTSALTPALSRYPITRTLALQPSTAPRSSASAASRKRTPFSPFPA